MDTTSSAPSTRLIVYAGLAAAVYVVLTIALAPLSFGPFQFRASNFVKPLALVSPVFAWAFMVGTALANLSSPFGVYDFGLMPVVELASCLVAYALRQFPWLALALQSAIIAAGVALFPLGIVLRLPFVPTFVAVLVPQLVILWGAYAFIWRKNFSVLLLGGR